MLTIICPVYNEEKYIARCIESIMQQDYPKDDLEVLFVDGMSTDRTREIIASYLPQCPYLRVLDNPDKIVPCAMNNGIKSAQGDIIIRLDAHAEYPSNYFSILVKKLEELEGADNVGGVCVTLPCNETPVAIAIAECLSNKFGMGNSYFRVGVKEVMSVDTVPFGCFRKTLFEKVGLYDVELIRNQDDELNGRIIKNGGKIYLLPQLEIKYYARDKVSKVWNMFYQYGLYKPLVNKKLGSPATIRQFFPLVFVLGLYIGLIAGILFRPLLWAYLGVLILYFGIGLAAGIYKAKKWHRPAVAVYMPFVFFIIHYAYGWGYIRGLFKLLFKRPFNAESNR